MSDEYTPTTEEARHAFIGWRGRRAGVSGEAAEAAFDRWLAGVTEATRQEERGLIAQGLNRAALYVDMWDAWAVPLDDAEQISKGRDW